MHRPFENDPGFVLDDGRGRIELWIDRPGWLLSRATGRFGSPHCVQMLSVGDVALRQAPRLRFVHDWREMTGFELSVTSHLVTWAARHARQVEHSTIATRSPFVTMAVRAANVTLNRLLFIAIDDDALARAFATW